MTAPKPHPGGGTIGRATAWILALLWAVGCGVPLRHLPPLAGAEISGRCYRASGNDIVKDVPYAGAPDDKRMLDVYPAAEGARAPVVVFIHGGSWSSGSRRDYGVLGRTLRAQGYVVVNVDYRLYPDVTYPVFLEDAVDALNWVRGAIASFGGDPDRVIVAGHSAGAHIVALMFSDDRFRRRMRFDPRSIRGLVLLSGAYDLTRGTSVPDALILGAMGSPENRDRAEPIRLTRADVPPLLIVNGMKDDITYEAQARAYADAMKKAGADTTYVPIDDGDHLTVLIDLLPGRHGPTESALTEFLLRRVGLPPPVPSVKPVWTSESCVAPAVKTRAFGPEIRMSSRRAGRLNSTTRDSR